MSCIISSDISKSSYHSRQAPPAMTEVLWAARPLKEGHPAPPPPSPEKESGAGSRARLQGDGALGISAAPSALPPFLCWP